MELTETPSSVATSPTAALSPVPSFSGYGPTLVLQSGKPRMLSVESRALLPSNFTEKISCFLKSHGVTCPNFQLCTSKDASTLGSLPSQLPGDFVACVMGQLGAWTGQGMMGAP